MNYEITDRRYRFSISLTTFHKGSISLQVYKNNSSTPSNTYTPNYTSTNEDGSKTYTYIVFMNSFKVGDVITRMTFNSGSVDIKNTHEGIVWLVDGMEYARNNSDSVTLNFEEKGEHDIQAVYVGNNSLQYGATPKQHFIVDQPPVDPSTAGEDNDGAYALNFVKSNLGTFTYGTPKKIEIMLTKGGSPVPNRTVQRVFFTGGVGSQDTNKKGIVSFENSTTTPAGKYKIGAFYLDENDHHICSCYKNVTIEKGTPVWDHNNKGGGIFVVGSQFVATLTFNNSAMKNQKISVYVNGKLQKLTTNDNGEIRYKFTTKGTYKFKLVYTGDKNHNKVELSQTVTVS